MGPLASPSRIRDRAEHCRALARGPVTGQDAAEWLQLAETWDRLANAVEAGTYHDAVRGAAKPSPQKSSVTETGSGFSQPVPARDGEGGGGEHKRDYLTSCNGTALHG